MIITAGSRRPVEEWIRKEGTHEAIVSHQTYSLAVSMLKAQTAKEPGKKAGTFITAVAVARQ